MKWLIVYIIYVVGLLLVVSGPLKLAFIDLFIISQWNGRRGQGREGGGGIGGDYILLDPGTCRFHP